MSRRLLIVVNDATFFLSHRLVLAEAARAAGYDVHIATGPGSEVPGVAAAGFPWHPLRLWRYGTTPWRELRTLWSLVSLYRRLRPDVVHHVSPKPVLYGTIAARLARVPAVVNAISGLGHAFSARGKRSLLRSVVSMGYSVALKHPRMRVIFQNTEHRDAFVGNGWVRADEAVLIAGSGVDVSVVTPRAGSADGREPVVVLVARLLATKGVREFVAAARALRAAGSRARFALVGSVQPGNPATIRDDELAAWVGEGTVEHWGFRRDMPAVYHEADVACLPSYTEGMPKSLIEAAAAGLPIVASDEPGCRAVVVDGENGFLVPVGDVAGLADALRRLLDDPSLRERFGLVSRRRAEREWALDRILEAQLGLYEELTATA